LTGIPVIITASLSPINTLSSIIHYPDRRRSSHESTCSSSTSNIFYKQQLNIQNESTPEVGACSDVSDIKLRSLRTL
ncbi:MAG: hypothetical protein EZS28_027456, partial [Streblomastix strix]